MRRLYALGIALILLTWFAQPVWADAPGSLEGKLTNGSKGGGSVAGLEVTLRPSDGGSDRKATSDSEGIFRFDGLASTAAVSYTVSLSYAGVDYSSPAVTFGAGENTRKIDVPVYETSEDSSAIQADIAHLILDIDPRQKIIVVTEFQGLSNAGDRTYVGKLAAGSGQRELLRFQAPDGAVHLQASDGVSQVKLSVSPTGGGFVDTTPFPPGPREVAYSYMLTYSESNLVFQRPTGYKTAQVNLLVSDVGAKVSAPGLTASPQPVEFDGGRYLVLSGKGLNPGQSLQVQLSGLPLSGNATQGTTDNIRLGAIVMVPLAIGVLLVLFLRNRRRELQPVPVGVSAGDDKVLLIRAMVELDDNFDRGNIPEAEYRRLRANIKRKLADLW
ncbi:MAG: carboxypeptidase-like regulatory domain-containing protein [Dehalococcoidia bacterium]|nr:carboxypeptidase-like regulatory domain-containing protein [Dehalococcoidia bacterium]